MAYLFFEFNSWLGFPPGAQVIFILETSLLAGLEALQTSPFRKYMSWNTSRDAQIGPVRTILLKNSLHVNGHNSLHTDSIDVPFVAYESRLQEASNGVG